MFLFIFAVLVLLTKTSFAEEVVNLSVYENVPDKNIIIFNVQNKKMHVYNCEWGLKCTRNCIFISKEEAIKRGGIPCQVCGLFLDYLEEKEVEEVKDER